MLIISTKESRMVIRKPRDIFFLQMLMSFY